MHVNDFLLHCLLDQVIPFILWWASCSWTCWQPLEIQVQVYNAHVIDFICHRVGSHISRNFCVKCFCYNKTPLHLSIGNRPYSQTTMDRSSWNADLIKQYFTLLFTKTVHISQISLFTVPNRLSPLPFQCCIPPNSLNLTVNSFNWKHQHWSEEKGSVCFEYRAKDSRLL